MKLWKGLMISVIKGSTRMAMIYCWMHAGSFECSFEGISAKQGQELTKTQLVTVRVELASKWNLSNLSVKRIKKVQNTHIMFQPA